MTISTPTVRKPGRPRDESLARRRRAEILHAASEVFAEHGYADTDLELVAEKLEVSRGTIYRYFPSKQELFFATVDNEISALRRSVVAAVEQAPEPMNQMLAGVQAYLSFFDDHPQAVELIMQERAQFKHRKQPTYFQHRDMTMGHWRKLVEEMMGLGYMRDMPPDRVINLLNNMLYGTIFTNFFRGRI